MWSSGTQGAKNEKRCDGGAHLLQNARLRCFNRLPTCSSTHVLREGCCSSAAPSSFDASVAADAASERASMTRCPIFRIFLRPPEEASGGSRNGEIWNDGPFFLENLSSNYPNIIGNNNTTTR